MTHARLFRQTRGDRFAAFIIEAHAIDHRFLGRITKHPRLRIPRLAERRDRADFDVAKTQRGRRRPGPRIFIEARREPDGVGEREPERLDRFGRRG